MNDFDDLLGDQPDVPDWPGLVRTRVTAMRRRRRIAATTTATTMLVLGTVGAVYAVSGSSQTAAPVLTQDTTTPTPEASTPAPPITSPTPTPLGTAPPGPPPPGPSDTPSSTPRPTNMQIGGYAGPPQLGHATGEVTITKVLTEPITAEVGQPVTIMVMGHWLGDRPSAWATTGLHPGAGGLPCAGGAENKGRTTGDSKFSATVTFDASGEQKAYFFLGNTCDDYYQGKDMVEVPVTVTEPASPTVTPT